MGPEVYTRAGQSTYPKRTVTLGASVQYFSREHAEFCDFRDSSSPVCPAPLTPEDKARSRDICAPGLPGDGCHTAPATYIKPIHRPPIGLLHYSIQRHPSPRCGPPPADPMPIDPSHLWYLVPYYVLNAVCAVKPNSIMAI